MNLIVNSRIIKKIIKSRGLNFNEIEIDKDINETHSDSSISLKDPSKCVEK